MYQCRHQTADGKWVFGPRRETIREAEDDAVAVIESVPGANPFIGDADETAAPSVFAQLVFGVVVVMTCLAVGTVCLFALRAALRFMQ